MKHPVFTPQRARNILWGSFESDGSNTPVNQLGDGAATHASTGTWTVTLDKDYGTMESCVVSIGANTGDQYGRSASCSNSTGVSVLTITVIDNSGGAVADIDGPRINWIAGFSQRAA